MRILFTTNELGTGGAEKLTVGYALGMARRGHHVAVAYGSMDSQAGPLREAKIELFPLLRQRLNPSTLFQWSRRLGGAIESFRPDVIHAQSVTSALAARLTAPRVPLLVTIHGISKSNEPVASVLLRAANVHLTAVSEVAAAGLLRHPWAPHVDILPPGIDADQIRGQAVVPEPPTLVGSPSLICVARQDRVKGTDILIRALPSVAEVYPDAALTVVGWGLDFVANQNLVVELGLVGRVRFEGLIPFSAPYLAAADLVVLPSRREGLPVVALEALALERPVVATDVGGTSAAVVDGETGWLVPPEDPAALATGILAALADREEGRRRARAGRALIEERFAYSRMLDQVETFLLDLTATRSRVPPAKPRVYHRAVRAHQRARILAWTSRQADTNWNGVRIFGYHRVSDDDDVFAVTPADFRAQMEKLRESSVTVLPLSDTLALLERRVDGQYVCITFDDGYKDNLDHAVPVLEDLGLPATIFLISDVFEGVATFDWYDTPPPHLAVEDLPRLLASGLVDVQAHSRTHRRLTLLDENDLHREIESCKERLEQYVPALTSFSYPAGIHGAREVAAVLDAGFQAGVSTTPGVNTGGTPLGELHRTMIYWGDDVRTFEAKLDGALDVPSRLAESLRARRARPRRVDDGSVELGDAGRAGG